LVSAGWTSICIPSTKGHRKRGHDKEEARELIAMFYIKINQMVMPFSGQATTQEMDNSHFQDYARGIDTKGITR